MHVQDTIKLSRSAKHKPRVAHLAMLFCPLMGCSHDVDWRDMRPEGMHVAFSMPCKPARQDRQVTLVGHVLPMQLLACQAHGSVFGLGHIRLSDATQAGAALAALSAATRQNINGTSRKAGPADVPGMTPLPQAHHVYFEGARPDGRPLSAWVTVFAYGPHVYQASVVGHGVDSSLVDRFRAALAIRPEGS
jgi:hypothetical protein